jgi:hypothetical protein
LYFVDQEVDLPPISVEKCQEYYPSKVWYPKQIHDSNICAGYEAGEKDACQVSNICAEYKPRQ